MFSIDVPEELVLRLALSESLIRNLNVALKDGKLDLFELIDLVTGDILPLVAGEKKPQGRVQ